MGISITDLKPSKTILFNGEIYIVVNCEHAKLGRGSSFCRAKLKNFKTAQVVEMTLRDSDNIDEAFIEQRRLQYLYHDGGIYHFLDQHTYEDLVLDVSHIEENVPWLKDNLEVTGLFYDNKLLDLTLPKTVELRVIETDPGYKGDTVKMVTKPAKLETGVTIQVPIFINTGDSIKVNTEKKEYVGRA